MVQAFSLQFRIFENRAHSKHLMVLRTNPLSTANLPEAWLEIPNAQAKNMNRCRQFFAALKTADMAVQNIVATEHHFRSLSRDILVLRAASNVISPYLSQVKLEESTWEKLVRALSERGLLLACMLAEIENYEKVHKAIQTTIGTMTTTHLFSSPLRQSLLLPRNCDKKLNKRKRIEASSPIAFSKDRANVFVTEFGYSKIESYQKTFSTMYRRKRHAEL